MFPGKKAAGYVVAQTADEKALPRAAFQNQIDDVRRLLEMGINPNVREPVCMEKRLGCWE